MRWLVTGAGGMVGSDVVALLRSYGEDVVACTHHDLDVTDADAVHLVLSLERPDVVVNAAAWTAVDAAEEHEDEAFVLNATAPGLLASTCHVIGARLLHLSTDYVFSGDSELPYSEDHPVAPLSAYGRTKAEGERRVLAAGPRHHVVRTAWLYGANGPSFVRTIARAALAGQPLRVVDDQVGSPTWTLHLARALVALGARDDLSGGTWHVTSAGEASWYVVARAVLAELGLDPASVEPVTSAEFPRPARRPARSVLASLRWLGAELPAMPHWRDALAESWIVLGEEFELA